MSRVEQEIQRLIDEANAAADATDGLFTDSDYIHCSHGIDVELTPDGRCVKCGLSVELFESDVD